MADRRDIRSRTTRKNPSNIDLRARLPRIEQTMTPEDRLGIPTPAQQPEPARGQGRANARFSASANREADAARRARDGQPTRGAGAEQEGTAGFRAIRTGSAAGRGITRTGRGAAATGPAGTSNTRAAAAAAQPQQGSGASAQPARKSAGVRSSASGRKAAGPTRRKKPSVSKIASSDTDELAAQVQVAALDSEGMGESGEEQQELVSTSVGELRRQERAERMRKSSRRYVMKIVAVIGIIVALLAGWAAAYNSPLFSIQNVQVNGVEHLTSEEMATLAAVPADTTLLRVDTDAIASRVKQSSWVKDVQINRAFPDTLEINVTERQIYAVVEMPNESGTATRRWAIADDRIWLMPIPDANTEAAQTTSSKIYEDAEAVVHIVNLPYGTSAEIGQVCQDTVVNNALDILQQMTTELSGQVVKVSAASTAETSLYLESGVEIAFGSADDIRDKERTVLKIMEENPDGIAYINVRMVENPTWRSL